MKLELKAYKCVFPNFYTDAYNRYMWQDPKQFEVIWGKNWKEAVKNKCQNDECYTYWELKQSINTRRYPEKDLYSQERSKLLQGVTDIEIGHLMHSLGVKIGEKCPDDFYRNYSAFGQEVTPCEWLVKRGLMDNHQKDEFEVYTVTLAGIEAVKTLMLVNKE